MTDHWRERLALLAPALAVKLDPPARELAIDVDGRTLAWCNEWERGPAVGFLDLATGRVLHVERGFAALSLLPVRGGFFGLDHGYRPVDAPAASHTGPRFARFAREGDTIRVETAGALPEQYLTAASPSGHRVLVWREGRGELCAWPSGRVLLAAEGYGMGVDWDAGCLFSVTEEGRASVIPLDGGAPLQSFDVKRFETLTGLGHGLALAGALRGLDVRGLTRPLQLSLVRAGRRPLPAPSLASDGQRLRVVLGGKPRRFVLDPERGAVLEAPEDAAYLARSRRQPWPTLWHPHADAVAYPRRWPRVHVRWIDGAVLCRLPDGATPVAWTPDGEELVMHRGEDIEIWRTPSAAPPA